MNESIPVIRKSDLLRSISKTDDIRSRWHNASSQAVRNVSELEYRRAFEILGIPSIHPTEQSVLLDRVAEEVVTENGNVSGILEEVRRTYSIICSRHGTQESGFITQPNLDQVPHRLSQQCHIRNFRVAVAGAGGVGGFHIEAMTREGIGALNIADPDTFELHNISRQLGATYNTRGQNKAEVMAARARDINPFVDVSLFTEGVTDSNRAQFLQNADAYVDGIDIFAPEVRFALFQKAYELGLPVCTFAPVGRGTASIVFNPNSKKTPLEHIGIKPNMSVADQFGAFLAYLSPALKPAYTKYMDVKAINPETKFAPALGTSCMMAGACAGMTIERLARGEGLESDNPQFLHFDWETRTLLSRAPYPWVPPIKRMALGAQMTKLGWRDAFENSEDSVA